MSSDEQAVADEKTPTEDVTTDPNVKEVAPAIDAARPLPPLLTRRYRGWKATEFEDNKGWYRKLAVEGQHPRAMVISCCDSRVHASSMFGADSGEFFIHRNIANLVPPYSPSGDFHGTSAALEYAVRILKVAHVLVLGHSQCGGIVACRDLCRGEAADLEHASFFIDKWLEILRPGYMRALLKDPRAAGAPKVVVNGGAVTDGAEAGDDESPDGQGLRWLEEAAILVSVENLMSFPFVAAEVNAGNLAIHGLHHDIARGELTFYCPDHDAFRPV